MRNNPKFYCLSFNEFGLQSCISCDGKPEVFNTEKEVYADIADFRESLKSAGMDDDCDWRAVPVSEYTEAELISLCGLE
jgi:hypothetical protein